MKLSKSQILKGFTETGKLIEWIVIEGLTQTLKKEEFSQWIDTIWNNGEDEIEIKLTIGGVEIDFQKLVTQWQSNIKKLIKEEALKIVSEKFINISDFLEDLQTRIEKETEKHLEDWEKE